VYGPDEPMQMVVETFRGVFLHGNHRVKNDKK
jgi:hypothetical protein